MRQALRRRRQAQDVRAFVATLNNYPIWRTEAERDLEEARGELLIALAEVDEMLAAIAGARQGRAAA